MGEFRPKPQPNFDRLNAESDGITMQIGISGELTASIENYPLGTYDKKFGVADVWLSVEASGKDDSNDLYFEADVKINGTSCLSTSPKISHVSGEDSQQKTTYITGDTGITQSVIDASNYDGEPGDVITFDFDLTRTSTPTTEILNPFIVVRLMPKNN